MSALGEMAQELKLSRAENVKLRLLLSEAKAWGEWTRRTCALHVNAELNLFAHLAGIDRALGLLPDVADDNLSLPTPAKQSLDLPVFSGRTEEGGQ